MSIPRINERAPAFRANSTHGEIALQDFAGSWVVLFSHPADFTPVCTTEFVGFARIAEELRAINTRLIGLSVDSIYSHIAWMRTIEEQFGVQVTFPVIADTDRQVAELYGMVHPGESSTATVRAVFVIDPEGLVRALIYYPLTTGRVVAEVLRLVKALQLNTEHALATPEGWEPGDACIVPPPTTTAAASERMESEHEVSDWFFAKTPSP